MIIRVGRSEEVSERKLHIKKDFKVNQDSRCKWPEVSKEHTGPDGEPTLFREGSAPQSNPQCCCAF